MLSMLRKSQDMPQNVGEYTIIERIARGGMADLYLGRSPGASGQAPLVAIKKMHTEGLDHPMVVDGFSAEIDLTCGLDHPHLVRGIAHGTDGGLPFLVMEHVAGVDLEALARRAKKKDKKLPRALILFVASKALRGLSHLHRLPGPSGRPLRMIHRDVSASNILISFEGRVVLIDYGTAHPAQTGKDAALADPAVGKLAGLPPEMLLEKGFDERADLYAMGAMLHELTCQRAPYSKGPQEEVQAVLARIAAGKMDPPSAVQPDVPLHLERIILRAMALKPRHRYATAVGMAEALQALLVDVKGTQETLKKWVRGLFAEEMAESLVP
jgi:serine/threonine protein kinase